MRDRSYGASTRRPVFAGKTRVPGLYERTKVNGGSVFEAAFRAGGKVRRFTLTAATKTDAIVEIRSLRVDVERGDLHRSPAAALSVAELAADYLQHLETRVGHRDPKRRYAARTVALYRQRLESHVVKELGTVAAADLTVAHLRRLADKLGKLSPSTVTGTLNIVSGMLRYGVRAGVLERNVARDLDRDDRPGSGRVTEPRYLTATEVAALLAKLGKEFQPIAAVCAYAGLRISETLGLTWRDVDLKAATLTVRGQLAPDGTIVPVKTAASAATVDVPPALVRALTSHRSTVAGKDLRRVHRDRLVFTTRTGRPQSRRNALRAVYAAGDAAGLNGDKREPVGLHDLRHSLVGIALAAGRSLADAAVLARHANAGVTAAVYAGVADTERRQIVAELVKSGFGG